ncbi:protein kinase domain-containing protein [Rhizobium leguminosarum]|uniref:protein kinase domain-containing protein n=1 Tax=Rhizobium leguminosarum TaxID=384 RepID=UPI0013EE8670|nr:protein kinase [Rhizobium leguminosarum]
MDSARAHLLEDQLKGAKIGEWTIVRLIDHGKSAAVFEATNGARQAAVKVFDKELIERFGDKTQLARIEREVSLKGRGHPSMVEILDGGYDETTKNHYIVMAFLPGSNLKKRLKDVPVEAIGGFISDIAACAEYLEALDLVHRDIKPENIQVSEDLQKVTLLDFGVLKPVKEPGITDMEGLHPFIGTLQYSSPEFLLREEDGTMEGWRALTFYQIGAVLHDLIMREALFSEYAEPFARLVNAVQEVAPNIQNSSVPSYLIDLAKMCLLKDPKDRLRMVTWESFKPPKATASGIAGLKERVIKRVLVEQAGSGTAPESKPNFGKALLDEIITSTKDSVRRVSSENDQFPPYATIARYPRRAPSVKMTFEKSDTHLMPELSVVFCIEIVDAEAKAVAVDVCVHTSATPAEPFGQSIPFFSGNYDPSRFHTALEEILYKIIDFVQRQTPKSDCWLKLEFK